MQFDRLQKQILSDLARDSARSSRTPSRSSSQSGSVCSSRAPSKASSVSASTPGGTPISERNQRMKQEDAEDLSIKISLEKNIFDDNLYHVALLTELPKKRKKVSPPPPPPTPRRPLLRFVAAAARQSQQAAIQSQQYQRAQQQIMMQRARQRHHQQQLMRRNRFYVMGSSSTYPRAFTMSRAGNANLQGPLAAACVKCHQLKQRCIRDGYPPKPCRGCIKRKIRCITRTDNRIHARRMVAAASGGAIDLSE